MSRITVASSGWLTFRRRNTITAYLFALPMIAGVCIFTVYPLASSLYHAFTEWSGVSAAKWVGLANFRYLLTQDPTFWPSLKVTVYYMALSVPAGMIAGLA